MDPSSTTARRRSLQRIAYMVRHRSVFSHLVPVRVSFHIQTLKAAKTMNATMLGHSGTGLPARSTSGRITMRPSCAVAINANITEATRNPLVCEFMVLFCSIRMLTIWA